MHFCTCYFFNSCGKELSNTDRKLQGDWNFVKLVGPPAFGENILNIIKLTDNEFEINGKYESDTDPTEEFVVSGKFYSDSTYIYLYDMKENQNNLNFTRCMNNDLKTGEYKFNGDTLVFSIYENREDLRINVCSPTHYLIK